MAKTAVKKGKQAKVTRERPKTPAPAEADPFAEPSTPAPEAPETPPDASRPPAPSGTAPPRPEEAPPSADDPWAGGEAAHPPAAAGSGLPAAGTGRSGGADTPPAAPEPPAAEEPHDMIRRTTEVSIQASGERLKAFVTKPQEITAFARPLIKVDEAVAAWKDFEALKERLLSKDDYYIVKGKARPTRTGWHKMALFFGVSTDIIQEKRWERGSTFGYDFLVVGQLPNGQHMVAAGTCDSKEVKEAGMTVSEHNVRSKAQTRAENRAISNLIGGGELSAEEVEGGGA